MRTIHKQSGFSVVEFMIVLLVLGLLGFAGYNVYNRQHKSSDKSTAKQSTLLNESPKATDVANAPTISNTSTLDKAATTLDQTDPSSSNTTDGSQLDSELANF